jgi:hypothetical protein
MKKSKLLTVTLLCAQTMLSLDAQAQHLNQDSFMLECSKISNSFEKCDSQGSIVRQKLGILNNFCEAFTNADITNPDSQQRIRIKNILVSLARKAQHDVFAVDKQIVEDDERDDDQQVSQVDIIAQAPSLLEIAYAIVSASTKVHKSDTFIEMCSPKDYGALKIYNKDEEAVRKEERRVEIAVKELSVAAKLAQAQAEKINADTKLKQALEAQSSTAYSSYVVPAAMGAAFLSAIGLLVYIVNPNVRAQMKLQRIKPRELITKAAFENNIAANLQATLKAALEMVEQAGNFPHISQAMLTRTFNMQFGVDNAPANAALETVLKHARELDID